MSTAVKLHVKKGDPVQVLSGKDKGKEGKILTALPKKGKVIVEGVNKVKRHTKPSQTNPQGGIVTKEAAIASWKVMLVCPSCKKPTRIAH
ncbi:MAG: 50S ribosomal protein L24, partial [Acidaminococcaceae bacterium]|nr:50S ribosomal protein L24 [Acidaminococcaceae bacterium]